VCEFPSVSDLCASSRSREWKGKGKERLDGKQQRRKKRIRRKGQGKREGIRHCAH
jgi:hypothetical protein